MIHCADCLHCKVFWGISRTTPAGYKERRVRCDMGHWKTHWGNEKTFSHHTVLNRQMESCDDFSTENEGNSPEEIEGDRMEFLENLRSNLPMSKQLRALNESERIGV